MISRIDSKDFQNFELLRRLTQLSKSPKFLNASGNLNILNSKLPILCIVGTRSPSDYSKDVLENLLASLSANEVITISGLALGVDAMTHKISLKHNIKTIAVPGSGLNNSVIAPRTNLHLSEKIISSDGLLLSPFENGTTAAPYTFPARNAIMASIATHVLITECALDSGTMITARLAGELGKEIAVIPGSIFNPKSVGPHNLIEEGAQIVYDTKSFRAFLGLSETEINTGTPVNSFTLPELKIIEAIKQSSDKQEIMRLSTLSTSEFFDTLTTLELRGVIKESFGQVRLISIL